MNRRHLIVLVKVLVAALLVAWLVRSGTLDFASLSVYFERPALLTGNLAIFLGTYVIAAVRWRLLLRIAGVELRFARAAQLTFIGAFFNVVAPGNIGGEVVKAIYVARDLAPEVRPRVYLVAFLDRLVAVAGLVAVAVVLNLGAGASKAADAKLAIILLAVATIVLPAIGLVLVRRFARRDVELAPTASGVAKLRARLIAAARLVAEKPGALILGLLLSALIHVCAIVWFAAVGTAVLDQHVAVTQMATVYPLGMLSVLLPISYAGFGVGHLAFEQLFTMVGLTGGANVLNVYLIGQLVPCLFGVVPYLFLKREPPPSAVELNEAS